MRIKPLIQIDIGVGMAHGRVAFKQNIFETFLITSKPFKDVEKGFGSKLYFQKLNCHSP
jgi:hypothetical protein